jgi:hypothetical protein
MEENTLSPNEVYVISSIEYLILTLYVDYEYQFNKINDLIDKSNIKENKDIMQYLCSLMVSKGYPDYAERLAKKYDIHE